MTQSSPWAEEKGDLEGLRGVSLSRREVSLAVGSYGPRFSSMCTCSLALESPSSTLIRGGCGHPQRPHLQGWLVPRYWLQSFASSSQLWVSSGIILFKLLESLCPSQQCLCHRTKLRSTSPRTVKLVYGHLAAVKEKLAQNSTFKKLRSWYLAPLLHGK